MSLVQQYTRVEQLTVRERLISVLTSRIGKRSTEHCLWRIRRTRTVHYALISTVIANTAPISKKGCCDRRRTPKREKNESEEKKRREEKRREEKRRRRREETGRRTEDGADAALRLGDGAAHERAGRVVEYGEAVDGQAAALDRLLQDAADVDALDALAAEALRPVC